MSSRFRILAAIDLSRPAEDDVAYAIGVATTVGAELHLLHVAGYGSRDTDAPRWPRNAVNARVCGRDVHRAVLHGPIARTIANHADALDADFVLMSSRRYGRWNRFWRKSVTDDVMRFSGRPVWVASETAPDPAFRSGNNRILCVVGLDGKDTALVQHAKEIAESTGAELVLLHVIPEAAEALLYQGADTGTRPLSRVRAVADLSELASGLTRPATTSVMAGDPGKCIPLAVQEHSAGMVLVSRGHVGMPAAYDIDLARVAGNSCQPVVTIPLDSRRSAKPDFFPRSLTLSWEFDSKNRSVEKVSR